MNLIRLGIMERAQKRSEKAQEDQFQLSQEKKKKKITTPRRTTQKNNVLLGEKLKNLQKSTRESKLAAAGESKISSVVTNALRATNIARKATLWLQNTKKKTATRSQEWKAEDKLAAESAENRDEFGNLLVDMKIIRLEPNTGTKGGGQTIHIHGEGFDVRSFEQGRMWIKWGQYHVPVQDFIDFHEVTCKQPPVPTLNTQDMRRVQVAGTVFAANQASKVLMHEELLYFDVSVTNDQGLNFSKSQPFYISPSIPKGTKTTIYNEMDYLVKPKPTKRDKKAQQDQQKQREQQKEQKEQEQLGQSKSKMTKNKNKKNKKNGVKDKRSSRGSLTNASRKLMSKILRGKKKVEKEKQIDGTNVNGVIVWGKNMKSSILKVGAALVTDGFDQISESIAGYSGSRAIELRTGIDLKEKLHNRATLHLKGSPVPHPRYIQFRTCLHITRLLSVCTGGLIDGHKDQTESLQFVFAAHMNKILAKAHKKRNASTPQLLHSLIVSTIFAHETQRANSTAKTSAKTKKSSRKNPTSSSRTNKNNKNNSVSSQYPLQPPANHTKAVELFLTNTAIVDFISYAVEHEHLLFGRHLDEIRDVQINQTSSSSEPSLQMILHEGGFVSMRCDSSVPSAYAQQTSSSTSRGVSFVPPGRKGALDQYVTVSEIRIPLEDSTIPPKVPPKHLAPAPNRSVYPSEASWIAAMERYNQRAETMLWAFINRTLHGRARKIHQGQIVESKVNLFEPGSGWFFSKTLLFTHAFQKIQQIACGKDHFCAITSKMDGACLYTWGNNKHGQLGRLIGKASSDMHPGLVEFVAVEEALLDDNDDQQLEKGVFGAAARVDSELRLMKVTNVCCGPEYTVCVGIGIHDGVSSVFSWGEIHTKPRRVPSHVKFRTIGENPYVSNLAGGVPHDCGRALPQEVLRLRPHRKLSSSILAALKFKSRVGNQRFMSTPLLFFPLRMSIFYKSEWKRWLFNNRAEVKTQAQKSKFSAWHRAIEGRYKRLSSRAIPILENRERAVFQRSLKDLREFGESCDRAAVMKQKLIDDVSDVLQIPNSNVDLEADIPVDNVILAFVQEARRQNTISPLEPLCFTPANTKSESDIRSLRNLLYKKGYAIPNDVAWADILMKRQETERELTISKTSFGELWNEYCTVSQEQEKLHACYSVLKTAAVRNVCRKGTRPGFTTVDSILLHELLMKPLDGGKKKFEKAEKLVEKRFTQRSHSMRRGSTMNSNPRSRGSMILTSSRAPNVSASSSSSSKDIRLSSIKRTSFKSRYQKAKDSEGEYGTLNANPMELALQMTAVWNNNTGTMNRGEWKTWSNQDLSQQFIYNINQCDPLPYHNEIENVLDILLQQIKENNIERNHILRKAQLLEKTMKEYTDLIDLYDSSAEDWILAHIIDHEKTFPLSNIVLRGENERLGVNTSTQYIHEAYKRPVTGHRTGFENRIEFLQDHWTKTNSNSAMTGSYGLAKRYSVYRQRQKDNDAQNRHERMMKNHSNTIASMQKNSLEHSSVDTNIRASTPTQEIQDARNLDKLASVSNNQAKKEDKFIPGSIYSLQDFLNMSTTVLKEHVDSLSVLNDNVTKDDAMMNHIIEMIADTAHLRIWNNKWAQQQCHGALHQLNELETFIPERAKKQFKFEKQRLKSQNARGVGNKYRNKRMKAKRNLPKRRSMTMDHLRMAGTGGNDLFQTMLSIHSIDEGDEDGGEGKRFAPVQEQLGGAGGGKGDGDGSGSSQVSSDGYSDGYSSSGMDNEPPTDVDSYVYKNASGFAVHSSAAESSGAETEEDYRN